MITELEKWRNIATLLWKQLEYIDNIQITIDENKGIHHSVIKTIHNVAIKRFELGYEDNHLVKFKTIDYGPDNKERDDENND